MEPALSVPPMVGELKGQVCSFDYELAVTGTGPYSFKWPKWTLEMAFSFMTAL